jgi:hypothetical protein
LALSRSFAKSCNTAMCALKAIGDRFTIDSNETPYSYDNLAAV